MSTVCVIGHPAPGHVNPTLPVTAELVRRGERAIYYATEPFRANIEKAGAVFRSYGEHALFERNLAVGGMLGGMAGLMETAETILPALIASVQACRPDYLLIEAHAVWGNLLAQIVGVPSATLSSMFAMNSSLIGAAELVRHLYSAGSCEGAVAGLAALSQYFEFARRLDARYQTLSPGIVNYLGNRQPLNIVFTAPEFQPGGELFDHSYRFVGPSNGSREKAPDFPIARQPGRPLIYISLGTMYNNEPEFYQACFEAFGGAVYDVILAAGHRVVRDKISQPPANFAVHEYVPQRAVLEATDLFITHGGINSAHEAMLCGVPMLLLPKSADHHIVARQVAEASAGIVLNRPQVTAERLRNLAATVLANPLYRRKSEEMGGHLRSRGGYLRAADEIFAYKERTGIGEDRGC